jgi:ATP-binding cassette, subfamily B, multidrug efflux pump
MSLLHDIRAVHTLIRPYGKKYSYGLGALLLVNLCDVFSPLFLGVAIEIIESGLAGRSPSTPAPLRVLGLDAATFGISTAILAYLGLQLVANVSRYPMSFFIGTSSHWIGQSIRRRITDAVLDQSQSFYDRSKSGTLLSIATADVQAMRMMLGPGVLVGADTFMIGSLVVLVLFSLSWQLTLLAMLPLPIIYLVTNKLSHLEYSRFATVQDDLGRVTDAVRESYAGIRILQGYGREEYEIERFRGFSWTHCMKNLRLAQVRATFDPTLDLMQGASTVLVLIFGGMQVATGAIPLGTFVAFLFLVTHLAGPMIGFGWAISLFQRGRASMKRIRELVDAPVEIADAESPAEAVGPGRISIRKLSFSYPVPRDGESSREVLSEVSLEIAAGTSLGVVGPVGSGKSTLAALLTRLYEPPENTVFLDEVDVRNLSLSNLRGKLVLAPQETFLFGATVEENILLGRVPGTIAHEDVLGFAQMACLDDEVKSFERGYETLLGERGVNLSGGQRQRLSIARAIATDPGVLILDDCLSAVDAQTEEKILANLQQVIRGRTSVVISHRIAAVERCDQIVVLEAGSISEIGVHEDLLVAGGYYQRIAEEQRDGGQATDSTFGGEP